MGTALALMVTGCGSGPDVTMATEAPAPRQVPAEALHHLERAEGSLQRLFDGDRDAFDPAVHHLEHACVAGPCSEHLRRKLARVLNLPLTEGRFDHVPRQHALYASLVAGTPSTEPLSLDAFVDRCFLSATEAALAYSEGHPLRALVQLRGLERAMAGRLDRLDEVDVHAMAGNYAHNIAGMVAPGRRRRVRTAIEHLDQVQRRWQEMSPAAQGLEYDVPGTRAVFAIWLAQLTVADPGEHHLESERLIEAERIARATQTPATLKLAEMAALQRARFEAGEEVDVTLPPWPRGHASCVACHSHTATLPETKSAVTGSSSPYVDLDVAGPGRL